MSGIQDAIGDRGQYIFGSLITKFHSESGPLFKCRFLGDKWPRVDFIVELLNVDRQYLRQRMSKQFSLPYIAVSALDDRII